MANKLIPDGIAASIVYHNLSYDEIHQHELKQGDTELTKMGVMTVDTGIYTGRSPKDKFLVKIEGSEVAKNVEWGKVNIPTTEEAFNFLLEKAKKHFNGKKLYVFDGYAGSRASTRIKIRVVTEKAWQHHFVTNMFIRPTAEELANFGTPDFTILNAAALLQTPEEVKKYGFNSDVAEIFYVEKKMAVITGTWYPGEMKKGVFSMMNYYKPMEGILTMHCSANVGADGKSALFFGLSGTGKTTLSTDSERPMVGDDEHGWDDEGIWNLEGGCYAKVVDLDASSEPEIWKAIRRGALLENVITVNGEVDFTNQSKTENTRVSYPIFHLEKFVKTGLAPHPTNIIFLSADAYGVLPPVSKLTPEQAAYHFLTGYTSKVAGTERGITTPQTTFSSCFGDIFMLLPKERYGKLLQEKMKKHNVQAWLVNTGWNGAGIEGADGGKLGKRMPIRLTKSIISAMFTGELAKAQYKKDEVLNLEYPTALGSFGPDLMDPVNTWKDKSKFEANRKALAAALVANAKAQNIDPSHGPKV